MASQAHGLCVESGQVVVDQKQCRCDKSVGLLCHAPIVSELQRGKR